MTVHLKLIQSNSECELQLKNKVKEEKEPLETSEAKALTVQMKERLPQGHTAGVGTLADAGAAPPAAPAGAKTSTRVPAPNGDIQTRTSQLATW